MSLVAEYESSSESDNGLYNEGTAVTLEESGRESSAVHVYEKTDDAKGDGTEKTSQKSEAAKLPSADSIVGLTNKSSTQNSVWTNQYKKEDEEKTRALEKHVKMVSNSKLTPLNGKINGKKVCWMYRRGRCRLGKKCQMYHDSELQTPAGNLKNHNTTDSRLHQVHSNSMLGKRPHGVNGIDENEDGDGSHNRLPKKKFGLSDDLVPSKKVINHFENLSGSKTKSGQ